AGMIAAVLSRADGAGEILHGGFVTYTNALKTSALGVCRGPTARKGRRQRGSRDATRNGRAEALAGFYQSGRQRRAGTGGRRGRQPGGTRLFLLREVGGTAGGHQRRIRGEEAGAAFAAHAQPRLRPHRIVRRRVPRLVGTAATRRTSHSPSVLDAFERLHGRHAVARLLRAFEPPRLKGTIWSPSSGLSAPQ